MPFSRLPLALVLAAGVTAPALAQEPETAYRMRISIFADYELVTAATWVGVEDRVSTLSLNFTTPYHQDIALSDDEDDAEGAFEGEVTLTVRPFHYQGTFCLDVELASGTVEHIYHYRSDTLLEVLPGWTGYSAGGPYCVSEHTEQGQLFDLSHGDDPAYAEILVMPEIPVKRDD